MSFFASLSSLVSPVFDGLKDSECFFFLYFIWRDAKSILLLLYVHIPYNCCWKYNHVKIDVRDDIVTL